ncbi:MAG: hypothetical protein AAFX06_19475 [Planctomycetota bacterium]
MLDALEAFTLRFRRNLDSEISMGVEVEHLLFHVSRYQHSRPYYFLVDFVYALMEGFHVFAAPARPSPDWQKRIGGGRRTSGEAQRIRYGLYFELMALGFNLGLFNIEIAEDGRARSCQAIDIASRLLPFGRQYRWFRKQNLNEEVSAFDGLHEAVLATLDFFWSRALREVRPVVLTDRISTVAISRFAMLRIEARRKRA